MPNEQICTNQPIINRINSAKTDKTNKRLKQTIEIMGQRINHSMCVNDKIF